MQFTMIIQEDKCTKQVAQRIGQTVREFTSFIVFNRLFGRKICRS